VQTCSPKFGLLSGSPQAKSKWRQSLQMEENLTILHPSRGNFRARFWGMDDGSLSVCLLSNLVSQVGTAHYFLEGLEDRTHVVMV